MRASTAAFALAFALTAALPAAGDTPVAAFGSAWAAVDNYTATITVHETDGKSVQDRVYRYAYKKPTYAKIDVVSGPGKGSGAVWTGGDHVRGHQGGFLSGIKMSVAITDGRATSLRGDTIDKASFASIADEFKNGRVDPATADATIDGAAVDAVTVGLTPAAPGGGDARGRVPLARDAPARSADRLCRRYARQARRFQRREARSGAHGRRLQLSRRPPPQGTPCAERLCCEVEFQR